MDLTPKEKIEAVGDILTAFHQGRILSASSGKRQKQIGSGSKKLIESLSREALQQHAAIPEKSLQRLLVIAHDTQQRELFLNLVKLAFPKVIGALDCLSIFVVKFTLVLCKHAVLDRNLEYLDASLQNGLDDKDLWKHTLVALYAMSKNEFKRPFTSQIIRLVEPVSPLPAWPEVEELIEARPLTGSRFCSPSEKMSKFKLAILPLVTQKEDILNSSLESTEPVDLGVEIS